MPGTPFLAHEAQARGRDRGRKLAKKGHDGLKVSPTFHDQTKGRGAATDSLGRQTRVGARGIRLVDEHADVAKPGHLRRTRHGLSQRQPLVPDDAE